MAILIRKSGELTVALCAVEADRQPEDFYLDDAAHGALSAKFELDFISMGFLAPRGLHPLWTEMEKHKLRDAEQDLIDWVSTSRPAPEPKCFECGDSGEVFGHADDCDNDSCALNGDIDSCLGKVEPCGCAPLAPDHANCAVGEGEHTPEPTPEQGSGEELDDLIRNLDNPHPKALRVELISAMAQGGQALRDMRAALAAMPTLAAIRAETTAQERERCAKVVEDHGETWGLTYRSMTDALANAIRRDPLTGGGE